MVTKRLVLWMTLLTCGIFLGFQRQEFPSHEPEGRAILFNCAKVPGLSVRFHYEPRNTELVRVPLILRSVPSQDARLGSAEGTEEQAITAYVSVEEMKAFVEMLSRIDLEWEESTQPASLNFTRGSRRYPASAPPLPFMEVIATCPIGSAKTYLEGERLCSDLVPLASALRTRRPQWEFEVYLAYSKCSIPELDPKEFTREFPQ
ncbi:hypothetical protein GWO13_00255 [Candidatus Bathyarchaeota archaeon]|nr:hypothetical protein [Candidatus Bathyarchaeota archaeon]